MLIQHFIACISVQYVCKYVRRAHGPPLFSKVKVRLNYIFDPLLMCNFCPTISFYSNLVNQISNFYDHILLSLFLYIKLS